MSADKDNDESKIKNKEAYDGIVGALLNGGMPKEVVEYDKMAREAKQEQDRLKKQQEVFGKTGDIFGNTTSIMENLDKRFTTLQPITMPIKIITKRVSNTFNVLDYTIEYQLNGAKGIIIKIIRNSMEQAVFSVGVGISVSLCYCNSNSWLFFIYTAYSNKYSRIFYILCRNHCVRFSKHLGW